MGFASKIAASQAAGASTGVYGGAPPSGYTGGPPPASLQPGNPGGYPGQQQQQSQYQAYPGSSQSPAQQYSQGPPSSSGHSAAPPYPASSPHQQYQAYNPPAALRPGASPSPSPYQPPSSQQQPPYGSYPAYNPPSQSYSRPPPPPPQPYGSPAPQPYGQQPYQPSQPQSSYGQPHSPYPPQGAAAGPGYGPGPQSGPPGGSRPATQHEVSAYRQLLISTIQEKQLQPMWPPERLEALLQGLAKDAPGKIDYLSKAWRMSSEIAMDFLKLSLFDIILYIDDSGSIMFEEEGARFKDLKEILSLVATAASLFDQDGITARFMNSTVQGNNINSKEAAEALISQVRFQGLTPMGTSLRDKVLEPLVIGPARNGQLKKPVLVITITDGHPAGEPTKTVVDVISHTVDEVSRTRYGRGAVSFEFAQVGSDLRARDFLSKLDEDPSIGGLIDCTSTLEVEQDEMSRANPPVELTRELWCAKLMLGAIDSSYDTKDEKRAGTGGAPPPPAGQYGGYNQAAYGQNQAYPPQGYGQQPYGQPAYGQGQPPPSGQGAYGQPQTAPRGYGQPYGGYASPPAGQGQYGHPPPYPPQQGGYGQAPPPPPRY
ncbi:hypothetical protein DTO166G4_6905 [Paecilomyces variotii]|nr:hypothetical protein DTO166G4_6905 [Paecilomyces variotii]KAJ9237692.1 hypothetical protein DTO166G5_3456 [Paecilomyces variotii]KAJ9261269.1 hypothetical protein DTO195F2_4295 [Paecilomyces variotii]